jgi:hypothetical protein
MVGAGAEGKREMILRTAAGLIALLVSSAAQSNYFTYQSWLALPETARVAYVSGAYDSLITFVSDEQTGRIAQYKKCLNTAEMTNFQLAASVMNFAKDKPQFHTGSVQSILINYLIAACGEPPTK